MRQAVLQVQWGWRGELDLNWLALFEKKIEVPCCRMVNVLDSITEVGSAASRLH